MKIFYNPGVEKQLRKLSKAEAKKVLRKIEVLAQEKQTGKALRGQLQGLRSLRAWPYRIIYQVSGSKIIIYSVAHRQGVYR